MCLATATQKRQVAAYHQKKRNTRVPSRFFGIRDLAYFKAGIRDFEGRGGGARFQIVIMTGTRDLAILTGGNREMSLSKKPRIGNSRD